MAEGEDKTEAATPRRLEKARQEGQVAVSRELSMLLSLAAGVLALAVEYDPDKVARWLVGVLHAASYDGQHTLQRAGLALALTVAPAAAASGGAYAVATLLQTQFLTHPGTLQPDLSRISPIAGIKRLFSLQTLVQALKSIAKLVVFAVCLWIAFGRVLPTLPASPTHSTPALLHDVLSQAWHLVLTLLAAQALIAAADVGWERASLAKKLRMTRQELRDEHKESEGNPQVKQRLRQLARAMARRRMLTAVPKAAVVVTNPTHYAVALDYERGSRGAPRVVAKGMDEVAERIRDIARENRVPIIANPPLARALFRVEIDTEIPSEHFKAVAEIIAYVWRMRARAARR
jgi:flagellar biosynthetic protein FlhB